MAIAPDYRPWRIGHRTGRQGQWRRFACASALLLVSASVGGCCSAFTDRDVARVEAHGGRYVLAGEGPWARCGAAVVVLHGTDDAGLLAMRDTLDRFHAPTLIFEDATITDASVDVLNKLKGLRQVDLGGAPISEAGLRRLKPKRVQGS